MCGSLLSKCTKSGNRVIPAPRTDCLVLKREPRKTKLANERTEVQISSRVERIFDKDTEIKVSDSTNKCPEKSKSESNAEERDIEMKSPDTKMTVGPSIDSPREMPTFYLRMVKERVTEIESAAEVVTEKPAAECPRAIPPVYRPTVDIKKVKEVVARDMVRLQKLEVKGFSREKVAEETVFKEKVDKEDLAKEKLPKEKFAKEISMDRKKLKAIQGGASSSSNTVATKPISSARSILLGKTKSAIAFEVLVGSKRKETVLLSARVPRRLRRLDNPPQLTAEVMSAKQLAAQEKRLRELERVRDCARACAQTGRRNDSVNDT